MKSIIAIILGVIFIGIVVLLCFSCCLLATKSDEYWDEKKKELERHNERR